MEVFVARQAIFDRNKEVYAYELLFRDSMKNSAESMVDGYKATRNVMASSLIDFGLKNLVGKKRAFINVTEMNLMDGSIELLQPEKFFIEILETVEPTPEILGACMDLKLKGYTLVLDDFVFQEKYRPLIDIASIIKIDFRITNTHEERKRMREIIPSHIRLLAEKVETEREYQEALDFGYVYFQGYFFCKPTILNRKSLSINIASQLLLLKEINAPEINFNSLQTTIESNPAIVHKLLTYINSPGIGLGNTITNIRQALVLLGMEGVQRWVGLICLRNMSEEKQSEIFNLALVRAKFCEFLAEDLKNPKCPKETAFLLGMFSLMDVLVGQRMESILDDMHLSKDLNDALLGHENYLHELLSLICAYEIGDFDVLDTWCEKNKYPSEYLVDFYKAAVHWTNRVGTIR